MKTYSFVPSEDELLALKQEDKYIRDILEVDSKNVSLDMDNTLKNQENYISSFEEVEKELKSQSKADEHPVPDLIQFKEDENYVKHLNEKFNYFNLPPALQKLLHGVNHSLPNDYVVPHDKKPDWLDMQKFKTGQRFAQKYFIGLNASDMLSTIVLFTFPDILETLIYTENSSTPYTAFRRYLGTVLKVTSWYDNDIWTKDNPGYRNLRTVRALHLNISKRLNSTPYEVLANNVSLVESPEKPKIWSDQNEVLLKDFQSSCPFIRPKPFDRKRGGKVFINQLDMSITQFAFVGLMVTYPERFGASSASKDELEGFLHMWRAIGYLLGIKDEFNFCNGTLEEVVQKCHSVIDYWVKPNLQNVTEDWEHMSRCLVEGLSYYISPIVMFEPAMMYLCWIIELPTPRLHKSLDLFQSFVFYLIKFMMNYTLRFPGMLPLHNWLLRFALSKAASMSPTELKRLENKKYDYQLENIKKGGDEEKRSPVPTLVFVYVLRLLL